jgi:glycosyltransferase involved in cell wall biosynthesis
MNICIVIPVYNSPYIYEVVQDLMRYDYKIIVVDDGSSKNIDLKDPDIEVITHKQNMGKGQAILTGAKRAKELGYDCFLTIGMKYI